MDFLVALLQNGSFWYWGSLHSNMQMSIATVTHFAPHWANLTEVIKVESGWKYFMVLTRDGKVYSFGANNAGQLGDGTRNSTYGAMVQVIKR